MKAEIAKTQWTREVYPPSDDSFALVDALCERLTARERLPRCCLEVGSGSGYVCVSLALMLKAKGHSDFWILATDVNPDAAMCTMQTAQAHGVNGMMDVVITEFWNGVRPEIVSHLDLIVFNPPYVPTPDTEITTSGIYASWAGGRNGRCVIDTFLEKILTLLKIGRVEVLMVTIEENQPWQIISDIKQHGFWAEVLLKRQADQEILFILSIRPNP